MPLSPAGEALGFVDADQLSALNACPLLLFVSDEAPYAGGLYAFEILDHAHAVFRSVALIKLFQPGAGKLFAADAELCLTALYPVTVFYSARQSAYLFNGIITPTTRAYILLSRISHAQPAVHPARSDQARGNRIRLCRFSHMTSPSDCKYGVALSIGGRPPLKNINQVSIVKRVFRLVVSQSRRRHPSHKLGRPSGSFRCGEP